MLAKKYSFHKAKSLKEAKDEQRIFDRKFDHLTTTVTSQSKSKYEYIPKYKLIELRTLLISKPEYFDINHKIKLITILSRIEEGRSMYLLESIVNLTLTGIAIYYKSSKDRDLKEKEIFSIFRALPYLTVCHIDYIQFYEQLLDYLILYDINILKLEQEILILHSLITLDFHITHKVKLYELFKKFLEPYPNKKSLNLLKNNIICKLWEVTVILKGHFDDGFFNNIFKFLNNKIKVEAKPQGSPSEIQLFFYKEIKELLSSKYKNSIELEYQEYSYSLDIAFPKFKINIEIDGVHHERLNQLRPNDKIRDYVLTKNLGWKVFRIKRDSTLSIFNNNTTDFENMKKIFDIPEIYSLLDPKSVMEFYKKNYLDKPLNQENLKKFSFLKNNQKINYKKSKPARKIKYLEFINSEKELYAKEFIPIENVYVVENIHFPEKPKKIKKKNSQLLVTLSTPSKQRNRSMGIPPKQGRIPKNVPLNQITDHSISSSLLATRNSNTGIDNNPGRLNKTSKPSKARVSSENLTKNDTQTTLFSSKKSNKNKKDTAKSAAGKIGDSPNAFFKNKKTINKKPRSKCKVQNTKSLG